MKTFRTRRGGGVINSVRKCFGRLCHTRNSKKTPAAPQLSNAEKSLINSKRHRDLLERQILGLQKQLEGAQKRRTNETNSLRKSLIEAQIERINESIIEKGKQIAELEAVISPLTLLTKKSSGGSRKTRRIRR